MFPTGLMDGVYMLDFSLNKPNSVKKQPHIDFEDLMVLIGISHILASVFCCGSCGYELNLNSSSRNTASIGSKYGKSIKKGMISFLSIDESRFTQVEEFKCVPFFFSKRSWGLFQRRTKLLCRKCGNDIGIAYDDSASSYPLVADASVTASGSETSTHRKYDIKIRSLQPSSSASGTPLPE
ncbi:uncharacterized protein At4g08330, chloroplastic isoform X1 [Nicotiana tomentosiformis]|uniref:uncharacterized protein At4g08330, chloroplastic isoform X1 n=1 Tax=Nicotiana tomentosiformis TaxID=4098 RepID=UPI00388C3C90